MLALPELKNNWRHTYVRRFRDDAERSRLECLPRQLFVFLQSYANNLATTTCAHETAGKKEKRKVVKRRSLSMHKCLIQFHHSRASSGCVRCDYTFAAAIAKPRRWDRLTPKDLSIFLMDLLSLPSRPPTPIPVADSRSAQDIRSLQVEDENYSHANLTHFQQMSIEVFMRETSAWLGRGLLRVSSLLSMLLLCCCRFTDSECVELNYFEWKWSSSDDKSYLTSGGEISRWDVWIILP